MLTKREAKQAGRQAGLNAASWKFDGNTTTETYKRFLEGYDAGDPEVMDAFCPPSWLSGEWAGESMNEILGEPQNERDENRQDDVAQTYEDAADQADWAELVRVARYQTK